MLKKIFIIVLKKTFLEEKFNKVKFIKSYLI